MIIKEIEELMKEYSRRHGWYTAFVSFLDYVIHIASHGHIVPEYLRALPVEDQRLLYDMFRLFGNQDPFSDLLGGLYEEIAGRGHKSAMGQFFTPMDLCEMMAKMVITGKQHDGIVEACEPCSGSGRNVLAGEKEFRRYGQRSHWSCVDLDITCVKMTVINLWINSISADVIHGNALTGARYAAYSLQVIGRVPIVVQYPDGLMQGLCNKVLGLDITDLEVRAYFDKKKKEKETKEMHEKYGTQTGLFTVSPQQEEVIKQQAKKIKKREQALRSNNKGGDQLSLF